MPEKQNPRRHPDTAYREIGDEGGLVVMTQRSEVKVLNPVGVKIYGMLDGKHSTDTIATAISEEFEVSGEQAATDVEAFLAELRPTACWPIAWKPKGKGGANERRGNETQSLPEDGEYGLPQGLALELPDRNHLPL